MPIYKAGIKGQLVVREIATHASGQEFDTRFGIGQLVDVEVKGPNSSIVLSVFPNYRKVGSRRILLLDDDPVRPGTTVYVTYFKA